MLVIVTTVLDVSVVTYEIYEHYSRPYIDYKYVKFTSKAVYCCHSYYVLYNNILVVVSH